MAGPKIAIILLKNEYKKIETEILCYEVFDKLKQPFRFVDKKMLGRGTTPETNELIRKSVGVREDQYFVQSRKAKQKISVLVDVFNRKLVQDNETTFDQLWFLLTKKDKDEIALLNNKANELSCKYS